MKKHFLASMLLAAASLNVAAADDTGVLTFMGLRDYTVYSISPNGEWAVGYFQNGVGNYYAFRWNLETNETELLSSNNDTSWGYDVANDGTVVGTYSDYTISSNGAPVTAAGYYDDNGWHAFGKADGNYEGDPQAVSSDGQWAGGAMMHNGVYTPVIWKDGEVYKYLGDGYAGCVYGISEDGKKAAGWTYSPASGGARVTAMWDVETGEVTYLSKEIGDPFNAARNFTSDGKHLLHFSDGMGYIYNVETGENTEIGFYDQDIPFNVQYTFMDDNLRVYGYEQSVGGNAYGTVYYDGSAMTLSDYFAENKIDVSNLPIAATISITAASADGKTIAVSTANTDMYEVPLIVRLDQNVTTRQPVALDITQIEGMPAAKLTWKQPVNNPTNLTGYNVYRGGEKINAEPVTDTYYIDNSLAFGDYTYSVTALYGDVESDRSGEESVTIAARAVSGPRSLYARQRGYNSAALTWDTPATNLIEKKYYDPTANMIGFGGGNLSFEFAIKYDKEEMDVYDGYRISKVTFVPRTEQTSWEIKIYSGNELVYSQPVTQELTYGEENVVVLDTPVEVSSLTDDVICAIAVTVPSDVQSSNVVGMIDGKCVPGYSDLVHLSTETEFYSLAESSRDSETGGYVFEISFALGMVLSSDADGADVDVIKQYNVYSNGELVGDTDGLSFTDKNKADGEYTYEVEAEYADGRVSDKTGVTLNVAADKSALPAISAVDIKGDNGTVNFKWKTPVDDDAQNITYSSDTYAQTVAGPESSNYGYVARAIYTGSKLKGLDGYVIKQLRFYPANDAIFTFTLYENTNEVAYVEVDDYTLGQWNTVELETPIVLNEKAEYTLDLDCFDGVPEQGPLGCDNLPMMPGYSNLYSVDGGVSFDELSGSTIGNWMMGMVAVAPDADPLPVEGYNVRIDGSTVTAAPVTEAEYTYDFGPDADASAQHRVAVDVIYADAGEVKGNTVFFTLDDIPSGISNAITANFRVYPNPAVDYVEIEGADVESITAYSTGGTLVGSAAGNRLDVSSYARGLYILKIKADGKVHTVKLIVER